MRKLILASLIMLALPLSLTAKNLELATPAAGVLAAQGVVLVTPPGGSPHPCGPEEILKKGWKLETRQRSSADLLLWDKSTIRVSQNTTITLIDLTETEQGNFLRKIEVATGRIWVDAQKSASGKDTFEVRGPQAVAAVKGTAFVVDAQDPDGTDIQVFEGSVQCTAADGVTDLVTADYEFMAPAKGKAWRERFQRSKLMAEDDWLQRNWQSRLEMMQFFKSHPQATVNLARMDPKMRLWLAQHFKRHPNLFRSGLKKKQWQRLQDASGRPSPAVSPSRPSRITR